MHQKLSHYVADEDKLSDYTSDQLKAMTKEEQDAIPDGWVEIASVEELGKLRRWKISHYGGSSSASSWRQTGYVTIYEMQMGYYLEATLEGVPFFSISSQEDQWGTWYYWKFGDDGAVLRKPSENGLTCYGQEWGLTSFHRALGVAIQAFADLNEPKHGSYDGTYVTEIDLETGEPKAPEPAAPGGSSISITGDEDGQLRATESAIVDGTSQPPG